ncbi:hypothetical protein PILCRDRAFT_505235 [Piloderma croceum F 1598]|uniref:Uncharacterized protein n=1 Tax=Piloderma croceum (strain F 1598) TaxID=765440 RepID=A0A0C3BV71_PILCF|nr:hypothetical protein PILCRDRAFT_505235 [Piloderma croceum F 1598]
MATDFHFFFSSFPQGLKTDDINNLLPIRHLIGCRGNATILGSDNGDGNNNVYDREQRTRPLSPSNMIVATVYCDRRLYHYYDRRANTHTPAILVETCAVVIKICPGLTHQVYFSSTRNTTSRYGL